MSDKLKEYAKDLAMHTDLFPWYWISYGEKCYAYAVVEAFPDKMEDENKFPEPGSQLEMNEDGVWCGENGVEMFIESTVVDQVDNQNGDSICKFIAQTHAELLKEHMKESGLIWEESDVS